MKINHKFAAIFVILIIYVFFDNCQASSIYSRRGIGLMRYGTSTIGVGMGGIGIANFNTRALPYLNPASLSFLEITRFEGSFFYENADIDFADEKARLSQATFNNFQAAFPLKKGFALGIGLLSFSDVSFKLSQSVEIGDLTGTESLTGSGGIERGFIQLGGRIGDWLTIGGGFDVYFGRISETWRLLYDNDDTNPTIDEVSTYLDGIGGHAGLILKISESINAGAVFYFPASMEAERKVKYVFGSESDKQISTVKLPFSHGYGVNFYPNNRTQVGLDVFLQSWGSIATENFLSTQTDDTYRLGVGFAHRPSNDALAGFFSKLTYRVGFSTCTLPYVTTSGEQVNENMLSFGFSVPFNLNISSMNLGFEYGKRGSIDKGGVEETVFRLVIGITGSEKWFVRR